MYTLKMKSPGFPAEKAEHKEEIRREVERLARKGYAVRVIVNPPRPPNTLFRQVLEVSMEISDLHRIRELGVETFFGTPCPNYIGVVFHDALWFSPKRQRGVGDIEWQSNVGRPWQTTSYTENGPFEWRLEADSAARTVEISGIGVVKDDELYDFYDVLRSVERRLRIGRKIGQLVGLAKTNNWEGVERLRREILDQTFALPL